MITTDWQVDLGGVTVGAGSRYVLTGPITGFGIPTPRSGDAERGDLPGDVTGVDVAARRVLTVAIGVDGDGAAEGWALLEALTAAWAPAPVDVALDVRLPGFAGVSRRFYGRPRGLDTDLTLLRHGWVDVLATFEALDPFAYGPEQIVELGEGDTGVMAGTAPSDRWQLVLDVTDSPATVRTSGVVGVEEPPLTVESAPRRLLLDGRARTIVDETFTDRYGVLAAGAGWPRIHPGWTTVTVDGATGVIFYRPAYL